ncbi:hypothetical protein EDB86DRAFT_1989147 [Lactarius hatsudake]|nr:hypothetical protein EDB86DRAFT_1989147 [Lactarius hatsudake]
MKATILTYVDESMSALGRVLAKKKADTERNVPLRKRTAPIDMHMNRTRLSAGADGRDWLARESAQGNISLPIPPVSSISRAYEPAPIPSPAPAPLLPPAVQTIPPPPSLKPAPVPEPPAGCFPRSSSCGTGGKSGRSSTTPF